MKALISFAMANRAMVLALAAAFVLFGYFSYERLPVEAYPDVTPVQFQVITLFPGHAAEETEQLVTIPVENEFNGMPDITSMRSISLFGLSVVTITFSDNTTDEAVRNLASQHLAALNLPPDAQASISPDSTPVGEIYRYTLKAPPDYPLTDLKALEDFVVERQYRTVPGVADVNGFGGPTKQYQVLIDPMKLKAYNLSLSQVYTALSNSNQNAGGGYIEHGQELYVVRGLGYLHSLADIGGIAVATHNGTPIRIRDIGTVQIGERARLGRVGQLIPGQPDNDDVVEGILVFRVGANPLDVLKRVEAKTIDINLNYLPPGVQVVPYYDRTDLISRAVHNVLHNMIEGIALVVVVVILFLGLGNIRSALIVATVVPMALLGAFTMLDLTHVPANLISLGAIDFGIIIDSAVVIIENIIRLLEEEPSRRKYLGATIIRAVNQMGKPILFSKAILITAFIPLYTMQEVEGRIFRPMALTLTFALIAGTILALTLVPVLASFALARKPPGPESGIVHLLRQAYAPALGFVLRLRWSFLAGAMALIVFAGLVLENTGMEFLPKLDEGSIWVRCFMPKTISPTQSIRTVRQLRQVLASFPEVRDVVSQLGQPDDGTDVNGWDVVECAVDVNPDRSQWVTAKTRDGLCNAMKARIDATIPGLDTEFSQNIEDNVNEAVSGLKGEAGVKIFGQDPEKLQFLSDQVTTILSHVPGITDISPEVLLGQPQVQITVNRDAIARYGLAVADVQSLISTALGGSKATDILDGDQKFDLVVKLDPAYAHDLGALGRSPLTGSNGELLTLNEVADIRVKNGFNTVLREGNQRLTDVKFSVRNRPLVTAVQEAEGKVNAAVKLPPGYKLVWAGSFEDQQRAMARLATIVPITLGLIFFLLLSAFNSVRLAFLIIVSVPFVLIGGVFALPLMGLNLSVSAMVGFLALFGVCLQNRVILVERILELFHRGLSQDQAIFQGALSRIRPVVMTATMATLGLLPAALSTAVGAETSRPFAVVIIGGLFFEIILTPFIIPILFPWFAPSGRLPDAPGDEDGDLPTEEESFRGVRDAEEKELAATNGTHER
jgi:cobalt-zinc-cadmium resistance protein CzcA